MNDELKSIRDELDSLRNRIDALDKNEIVAHPFYRGEPILVWSSADDTKYLRFFVEFAVDGCIMASRRYDLEEGTFWDRSEHLPTHIDWSKIDYYIDSVIEFDSGLLDTRVIDVSIGEHYDQGTVVAIHHRPEATK